MLINESNGVYTLEKALPFAGRWIRAFAHVILKFQLQRKGRVLRTCVKLFNRVTIFLVAVLFGSAAQAYTWSDTGIELKIPAGFELVFEAAAPQELIEYVPRGDRVDRWSEMVTLTRLKGSYLDANGELKDYGSIHLLAFVRHCQKALMTPVIETGRIGEKVAVSTSFACETKSAARQHPSVDVRAFEFLSVTYVQFEDAAYQVQHAMHFDSLDDESLSTALTRNTENMKLTKEAFER